MSPMIRMENLRAEDLVKNPHLAARILRAESALAPVRPEVAAKLGEIVDMAVIMRGEGTSELRAVELSEAAEVA